MSVAHRAPTTEEVLLPPADLVPEAPERDVALDLLRGLAMVVLVVNHTQLESALGWATEPFLSAAETLVAVSGIVVGMVFGRRWRVLGARAATRGLLRRAFELYRASVCVVALVALLTLVPGLATEAVTVPAAGGPDLYAVHDGLPRLLLAIVTLETGPWPFAILGFFVAALALTPAVLWLLARGWWPLVLVLSWAAFAAGRATTAAVLPFQSEGPFPFLLWQALFVHGAVLGWHRRQVVGALRRHGRWIAGAVLAIGALAAYVRLHELGLSPFGHSPAWWQAWDREHFSKAYVDAARLVSIVAFAAVAYLALRRLPATVERAVAPVLLALGRNSFYVFIVHVFVLIALASVPSSGANALVQLAVVALLVLMVRGRVLFGLVPR